MQQACIVPSQCNRIKPNDFSFAEQCLASKERDTSDLSKRVAWQADLTVQRHLQFACDEWLESRAVSQLSLQAICSSVHKTLSALPFLLCRFAYVCTHSLTILLEE